MLRSFICLVGFWFCFSMKRVTCRLTWTHWCRQYDPLIVNLHALCTDYNQKKKKSTYKRTLMDKLWVKWGQQIKEIPDNHRQVDLDALKNQVMEETRNYLCQIIIHVYVSLEDEFRGVQLKWLRTFEDETPVRIPMRNGLLVLWGEVPERGGCQIVVPPAPDEAVGRKQRNKQRIQTTPRLDILKGTQRMPRDPSQLYKSPLSVCRMETLLKRIPKSEFTQKI